jgi:competence ComEA-like helix-hairpin-helix protein
MTLIIRIQGKKSNNKLPCGIIGVVELKLNTVERIAILLTVFFMVALLAYHLGRESSEAPITVITERKADRAEVLRGGDEPLLSPALSPATAEEDASKPGDTKININTATVEELCALPGIGEVLAERIIDYRRQNGDFEFIEDIMEVKGIGEGIFAKIRDYITV